MKFCNNFAVLAMTIFYFNFCNSESTLIVRVKQGSIQGIKSNSLNGNEFYSFMSIPYAEPPIGKLRFKEPVPLLSWPGTIDGSKMPESCLQYSMYEFLQEDNSNMTIFGKEDCLYLNVFTPKPNDETANLPVMVYIHGGVFMTGGADVYPPDALLDKEIVLVVIQYRLGVLGFLSTEDSELPGNMGLKDQQLALKWIKRNIAKFGGDSNRVTLFGNSAGAISTYMQMFSPGSKDLFQRIIAQSGTLLCPSASKDDHRAFAEKIGKMFNCPLDDSTEEYVQCMQNIHAKYLIEFMFKEMTWGMAPAPVRPRIDGDFFPDNFMNLLIDNKYNKVDVISGTTKDDGALIYLLMIRNPTLLEELNRDFDVNGPLSLIMEDKNAETLSTKVYQHYLGRKIINNINLEKDREQLVKLYTDRYFGVCNDITSFFLVRDEDISLYRYQLDYKSKQKTLTNNFAIFTENNLICHGDELYHIFSGPPSYIEPEVQNEDDLKMRDLIISAWTNFAATGNPVTPTSGYVWDKATLINLNHLSLTPTPKMEKFNETESRKFWLNLETEHNLKYFIAGDPDSKDEL